ncbi:hypothetical protein L218DRAFT_1080309 [Marasmius fiardii PR-910]|nr:hypothetical protein L218DRAFT_1080309 [Marasmius fiardii PR-910]
MKTSEIGLIVGLTILAVVGLAAVVTTILLRRRRKLRTLGLQETWEFVGKDPELEERRKLVEGFDLRRHETRFVDSGTHRSSLPASLSMTKFIPSTSRPDNTQYKPPHDKSNAASSDSDDSTPLQSPTQSTSHETHSIYHLSDPFRDNSEQASLLLSNPDSVDVEDKSSSHHCKQSSTSPPRPTPQHLPPLVIPSSDEPKQNPALKHFPSNAETGNPSLKSFKPDLIGELTTATTNASPSPQSTYSQASATTQRTFSASIKKSTGTPPPPIPILPSLPPSLPMSTPLPILPERVQVTSEKPESEADADADLHRVPTAVISNLLKSRVGAHRQKLRTPTLGTESSPVEHIERSGSIISRYHHTVRSGSGAQPPSQSQFGSRGKRKFEGMHSLRERSESVDEDEEEEEFEVMSADGRSVIDPRIASYYGLELESPGDLQRGDDREVRPLRIVKR